MKSMQLSKQIQDDRRAENVHLLLCDAMFRLQDWRGDTFHFHLEQPAGSKMLHQSEMGNIMSNTLRVSCDMCIAGALRHPESHAWLKKRTQIWTTSAIVWRTLEKCQCAGAHQHDQVAGSCRPPGGTRMPLTRYTELYAAKFAKRLCKAIQCSCHIQEQVVGYRTMFAYVTSTTEGAPELKRRRLAGKFHPEHLYVDADLSSASSAAIPASDVPRNQSRPTDPMSQVRNLIQMAEKRAPRVGKVLVREGPLFEAVQELHSDKEIKVLDICRGINRTRTCSIGGEGFAPFRRAFGKRRSDLEVFHDAAWEAWEQLSHRQRAGIPARLLVTAFASNKRSGDERPSAENDKHQRSDDVEVPQGNVQTPRPNSTGEKKTNVETQTTSCVPNSHGPLFKQLHPHIQSQIKKIHQNLGHPDSRVRC